MNGNATWNGNALTNNPSTHSFSSGDTVTIWASAGTNVSVTNIGTITAYASCNISNTE